MPAIGPARPPPIPDPCPNHDQHNPQHPHPEQFVIAKQRLLHPHPPGFLEHLAHRLVRLLQAHPAQAPGRVDELAIGIAVQRSPVIIRQRAIALGRPGFPGNRRRLDPLEGRRVQPVLAQALEHVGDHFLGLFHLIPFQIGIQAEQTAVAEALALAPRPVGQPVLEPQLFVQRPVQVALQQFQGFVVLVAQHRLEKQPAQPRAVAQQPVGQGAVGLGLAGDAVQCPALRRLHRLQFAPGPFQVGWQHPVESADDDQAHVVRHVPAFADLLHLLQGHAVEIRTLGAFQPQLHRQLATGALADVLAVEEALQARIMPTVLAFDDAPGLGQVVLVELGTLENRQQQVEDLALVARRGLDDEGGVGVAGVGVPFTAQGLHAFFQAAFAAVVDAAEQQVLEQVRQFFLFAGEVIQADAHHQADRHMIPLVAGLEQHLQPVGQQVALDLVAIEGKAGGTAQQQADEYQATHAELP